MTPALGRPLVAVVLALVITASMDGAGLTAFSALPLCPLAIGFWLLDRMPRASVGLTWGRWSHYCLAALYPVLVLGAVAVICVAAGAADLSTVNWQKGLRNVAIVAISTALVAILTEEGFFRGWLWASLRLAGIGETRVLLWSSVAFALWHLSWVTLTSDRLPLGQIPVFIVNAAVIGAIWGLMRWISGSVIVASVSHGLWNGLDYVFLGVGTKIGALGIADTAFYGPEVGILGLAINAAFAAALWRWWSVHRNQAS